MSVNLTNPFIDDLFDLGETGFSDAVIHQAKRCLLDYLGATFAGARMLNEKGEKLISCFGQAHDAAIIGFSRKTSVENAAFVNGLSSHVAELDDGVRFGMIHPGSPVFSALLPVAEREKVSGVDLLKGIIAGYEAEVRVACAIQPSHYNRGYHPTSTCGTIGAAIGIAAMLNFSRSQMKNALSASAAAATGNLKVLEDGSELKPFNVARATLDGLMAASLAQAGFNGPEDVLSGSSGFFAMMADEFDPTKLQSGSDEPFAVEKVYVKPYASCRHTHPAIEAAAKIRAVHDLCANDIREVRVIMYDAVLGKHDHKKISGVASAKMSIPYSTAVALVTGKAGLEEFSLEYVSDPDVLALTKKTTVYGDDELSALVPQKRAAIIEVLTASGACYSERVDFPKGEPETRLSDEELIEKFSSLFAYGGRLPDDRKAIIDTIWNIERDLPHLFQLL